MSKELLKQALDALNHSVLAFGKICPSSSYAQDGMDECDVAITAIKEALAELDADAIIIKYHEATIKRLEKRIEELVALPEQPAAEKELSDDVSYEVWQRGVVVAKANGPNAAREIGLNAAKYSELGPVQVFTVIRMEYVKASLAQPAQPATQGELK